MFDRKKNKSELSSKEKVDYGYNLDVEKREVRSAISCKDDTEKKEKMKSVKASENASDKENPDRIAELKFSNKASVEMGYDKDGLILGFRKKPMNRMQRSVFENKSSKHILDGENYIESNNGDFRDSAELLRSKKEKNSSYLLDSMTKGSNQKGNESEIDVAVPLLEKNLDKTRIEDLYKIKEKSSDKNDIQEEINERKDLVELKKQKTREFENKLRRALSVLKRYKSTEDFYILYIKKKWQELLNLAFDNEGYKITSEHDLTQDVRDAIIFLYSNFYGIDKVKENLRKIMNLEVDESIILKSINESCSKFEEDCHNLDKSCLELFVKDFDVLVGEHDKKFYVAWGNFKDNLDENVVNKKILGMWGVTENRKNDWKEILKNINSRGSATDVNCLKF